MTATAKSCTDYQLAIRRDPEDWMQKALGVVLWGDQIKVARAIFQSDNYNLDFLPN